MQIGSTKHSVETPGLNQAQDAEGEKGNKVSVAFGRGVYTRQAWKALHPDSTHEGKSGQDLLRAPPVPVSVKVELPESMEDSHLSKVPFVAVRNSAIHGKGSFAEKSFEIGEKVAEYTGRTVLSYPSKQYPEYFFVAEIDEEELERDNIPEKIRYLDNDTYVLWSGIRLEGTYFEFGIHGTSTIRYINHSKTPNTKLSIDFNKSSANWSDKENIKVSLIAIDEIKSGDELCFDYQAGSKKRIDFKKNLVMNIDDFEGVKYTIESTLPFAIFGKKGYVIERGIKRKCSFNEESVVDFWKRVQVKESRSEKAGVPLAVVNAFTRESFHQNMPEEKWERYGDLWNFTWTDGNRELDSENQDTLEEMIDDINNEELDLEYRLKLLHTTECLWVSDNMAGDWKTCIKPRLQAIKNTALDAGVTDDIVRAEKLWDFHDKNELSDSAWRLCANLWNRLSREEISLSIHDCKALEKIKGLVSDSSQLSPELKNKLRHTTNIFWAEAGYSVDWQVYVSRIKP